MNLNRFFSYRKKVSRILTYSLVGFVFVLIGIGMGYKFAKKPFYFYNQRYDVVLTDSMSSKNEKYEDFLKDTKQIQAFDFVISNKINDSTKLNVFDVVIFDNPDIGIDMHRIVEVDRVGDTFQFNNLAEEKIGDLATFKFVSPSSSIVLVDTFIYTDFEAVAYTKEAFDENEYYFNVGQVSVTPTITSSLEENGYFKNIICYHRNSASPTSFSITKRSYEYKAHFYSVKLTGGNNDVFIDQKVVKEANGDNYVFNVNERYLIRGDKSNTDDGWYERQQLQAKVVMTIPKAGYIMRFLSTPYGTLMIIGLMFIPIIYWFIFDKKKKEGNDSNDQQ